MIYNIAIMSYEYTQDSREAVIDVDKIPNNDPGIRRNDPGPTSKEIELLQRRELAIVATDAVAEVLEVDVTPSMLLVLASATEKSDVRLAAVRALRCIESIAKEDSAVIAAIGEKGIYHYVEGVIEYGASEPYWLALLDTYQVDAEGATALYDLREQISLYTNGRKPGFRAIHDALATIGQTVGDAVRDPEGAVLAMYEAGLFVQYAGKRTFDQPIFSPKIAGAEDTIVDDDPDGSVTRGIVERIKSFHDETDESRDSEVRTVEEFVRSVEQLKV